MAENKKKNAKSVIISVLCLILGFVIITISANAAALDKCIEKGNSYGRVDYENQLIPQKDENGNWVFTTDRDFKILQITDVHIGGGFVSSDQDAMSVNAVATMITREKPDLVVVTGDIAYPVPVFSGTFNNKNGAKAFAELMEKLGVYWTLNFGNHDTEAYSFYSRKQISEFYLNEEYKYCLFETGPEDVDGYGNHTIEVKNSDGIITQALVMIDSNAYTGGDVFGLMAKYDNIHENQVQWYKSEIERMNSENSAVIKTMDAKTQKEYTEKFSTVKSLAFFHIPLVETRDAWEEFAENGFKDTENFKYIEGIIGETGTQVCCGIGEDSFFETVLELGSTKAIFNGHDHYNNTTFEYKGVTFSYGYSVDYLAYIGIAKYGSQRGCSLITSTPDGDFTIEKFNYYSDRYDIEGFEREDTEMQFDGIEYEVPYDK